MMMNMIITGMRMIMVIMADHTVMPTPTMEVKMMMAAEKALVAR